MSGFYREMPELPFVNAVVYSNRLAEDFDFREFLFFPGMLFASREKWWAGGGLRSGFHEGLDLCFFAGAGKQRFRLDETCRIPAAFDGRITGIIRDFLGSTVIVEHRHVGGFKRAFVLYAHLNPDENIRTGRQLYSGETFAGIAPSGKNRKLPPHLHLSVMLPENLPSPENLDWQVLNSLDADKFMEPMGIIGCSGRIIDFNSGINLFEDFIPVG